MRQNFQKKSQSVAKKKIMSAGCQKNLVLEKTNQFISSPFGHILNVKNGNFDTMTIRKKKKLPIFI